MEAKFNLILQTVPEIGKIFRLETEICSIGRDPENSIVINHPEVSRKHILLLNQNETYFVQDLGSMNGSYVDGERVEGMHSVNPGDIISLGETVSFIFQPIQSKEPILSIGEEINNLLPNPIECEFTGDEPVEEINEESVIDYGEATPTKQNNQKMKEFTNLLIIILAVVVICVILGIILFLWFIDTYSLWCSVLPFLFQEGVCP